MNWYKPPPQVFDGGVLGRDRIGVFSPQFVEDEADFHVYSYEDTSAPVTPVPAESPPAAEERRSTPRSPPQQTAVTAEAAARREQEAYERGRQEAEQAAQIQLQRLAEQLEGAAQFFHDTIEKIDRTASRQAFELAVLLAEKLFRKSIDVDPNHLLGATEELVDAAEESGAVRIVVDPATAKRWQDIESELQDKFGDRTVTVEAQQDLAVGDIIVHCGSKTLDDRVSHRLRQYEQALEQELGLHKVE